MEWSVHIQHPRDVDRLDDCSHWESGGKLRPFLDSVFALLGSPGIARCAWGTEFCENLIASPAACAEVRYAVQARGLAFTLLTPYVSNRGLALLRPLFDTLPPGDEVVFNDWGVLHLLRREFPLLVPVQGRLLHKALRDPRITTQYVQLGPAEPLRSSAVETAAYSALLRRFNVRLAEMDLLPQGNSFARGIPAAVYVPFGMISTARVCQAAGLGYRRPQKFQPGAPCRHECQTHLVEFTYTNSPFANRDQRFWLKGNTYFYVHTPGMIRELLQAATRGDVARCVWQPRLPMLA